MGSSGAEETARERGNTSCQIPQMLSISYKAEVSAVDLEQVNRRRALSATAMQETPSTEALIGSRD